MSNDIEVLSMQAYGIKNLSLLLEDYFYQHRGDKDFCKNQTLASTIVEKLEELTSNLDELWKKSRGKVD